MEFFSWIDTQVSSTCDTCDLLSLECSIDSAQNQKLSLANKSVSPPSTHGHEGMIEVGELEHLKETFKQKTVEFERNLSGAISLPSFGDIWMHSPINSDLSEVQNTYQDHPEMDCISWIDPHVSSTRNDTYGLLSFEDILDMEVESKHDNLQGGLMRELYQNTNLRSIQPAFCLSTDFRLSPPSTNQVAAAAINQKDHQQITEHHSHQQKFRAQEHPKLDSSHLSYLLTSMQTPPAFIETRPQKQSSQMSLAQQSMSPTPEPGYEELRDIWQLEHLRKTLRQSREELDFSIGDIPRIDTQVGSLRHQILDLQSNVGSADSDQKIYLDNTEQALTSQVSRNPKLSSFQSVFCLPTYNPPSKIVVESFGALEEAQTQFQLRPRQQSYHQRFRTQEISKTAPTLVMKDSQPIIKNHAESIPSLMDLLHKSRPTSPEQGSIEMTKEELSQFVENFKKWRKRLSITPEDVTLAIGKLLGKNIKRHLINNFEKFNLSTEMMLSFKSVLHFWLQDLARSLNMRSPNMSMTYTFNTSEFSALLVNRSKINPKVKQSLEKVFLEKHYPAAKEIAMLAKSLNMEKQTVQTWFRNRRRKKKLKETQTG